MSNNSTKSQKDQTKTAPPNKTDLSEERLPFGKNLVYALQHVFIMVAGAIVVPMSVGQSAGDVDVTFLISCALFVAGIATLLQTLGLGKFFGAKIAVVEGTSFAALSALRVIAQDKGAAGIREISGAVIIAGLFIFLMSGVWGKLLKFFPPLVTGTVVTIIGISLFPIAIKWISGQGYMQAGYSGAPISAMILAGSSLLIVLLCNKFLKGMLGNLSVLFGIIGGTLIAVIHDLIQKPEAAARLINFDKVAQAGWVGIVIPFKYGAPTFSPTSIITLIIIMLVVMTEATGNMIAVHDMSGKKIDEKNLSRGLRSSGLVTMISGVFNSYPVTPFGQNVGMLSLTGIFSRFVTATSGIILLVLAFFPKFGALFAAIPPPVLGGVGFAMFGAVAVNGIRTLGKVDYNGNKNAVIVAISIGLSLIPSIVPNFFDSLGENVGNILHSGMTIGCIAAILLNLFFNVLFAPKDTVKDDAK